MFLAEALFHLNMDFSDWFMARNIDYCVRSTEQVGYYTCTTLQADIE